MTEQSVKRKITGRLKTAKRLTAAAFAILPVALIIAAFFIKDFAVLIVFLILIAAALPFEIFAMRFFFRLEYDYALYDGTLTLSIIRNGRYGKTVAEIVLAGARLFPFRGHPGGEYRRTVFCGDDELSESLYGIEYREPDTALPDLIIFSPDEKMLGGISRYIKPEK